MNRAGRNPSQAKRFARADRGATAVEFAIVGPVFLMFLFSMIETGLAMTRISLVDHAVSKVAKEIYTGKAPTRAAVEAKICEEAFIIFDCANNINVELTVVGDFQTAPTGPMECRESTMDDFQPTTSYQTGSTADIVFMRVCVTTDLVTPGLGFGLALPKSDSGKFNIVSSMAFMNEPF